MSSHRLTGAPADGAPVRDAPLPGAPADGQRTSTRRRGRRHRGEPAPTEPERTRAAIAPAPGGFVLGYDTAGEPVVLRMFRPAPTRLYVDLVPWAVRVLVYRTVAIGAGTAVVTDERHYWQGLADTVGSAGGTISLHRGQAVPVPRGTPYRPSLIVDASPQFDGLRYDLGRWQTVFSLQSRATPRSVVRSLRSCDGALLHRADAPTAEAVRQAYALDRAAVDALIGLDDESVAVAVPRRLRVAALRPTALERQSLRLPGV